MKRFFARVAFSFVLLAILAFAAGSALTMLVWNYALVPVFHIGAISFFQAAGILLLARLLFGGRGRRGHRGCSRRMHRRYAHVYVCEK